VSTDSLHFAGVVLTTVPAIALGGVRLLRMIFRREPATSTARCARTSGGQVMPTPVCW
jgi:hypothetical protein